MADGPDTPAQVAPEQPAQAAPPAGQGPRRDRAWPAVTVAVALIVIVLILLMLHTCSSSSQQGASSGGPKQIVPVAGLRPLPGAISVWVAQNTTIDTVLSLAGVSSTNVVDMGGGRFVVAVPIGTEAAAVKRLRSVTGVYDAGLVFTDQRQSSGATATPPGALAGTGTATGTSGY